MLVMFVTYGNLRNSLTGGLDKALQVKDSLCMALKCASMSNLCIASCPELQSNVFTGLNNWSQLNHGEICEVINFSCCTVKCCCLFEMSIGPLV